MISYAINFEDVMLWRALKNIKKGFYVDVGAGRPDLDSVTKHFYEPGWTGINIEPHPEDLAFLVAARPKDVSLNIGIEPGKGPVTFFQNKVRGWSTLDVKTATEMRGLGGDSLEVRVECRPLQEVMDRHGGGVIHFLKIDVEGYEEEALKTLDLKKTRPWIIVLEAADIHARLPELRPGELVTISWSVTWPFHAGEFRIDIGAKPDPFGELFYDRVFCAATVTTTTPAVLLNENFGGYLHIPAELCVQLQKTGNQ